MADRVIQRNDTAARWQSINPVLATGEIGIEIDGAKGYKIGDGKTRWNDLPYPANPTNVVQELGNNENAVPSQKLVTEKLSELGSKVEIEHYLSKAQNSAYNYAEDLILNKTCGADGTIIDYNNVNLIIVRLLSSETFLVNSEKIPSYYMWYSELPNISASKENFISRTERCVCPENAKYCIIQFNFMPQYINIEQQSGYVAIGKFEGRIGEQIDDAVAASININLVKTSLKNTVIGIENTTDAYLTAYDGPCVILVKVIGNTFEITSDTTPSQYGYFAEKPHLEERGIGLGRTNSLNIPDGAKYVAIQYNNPPEYVYVNQHKTSTEYGTKETEYLLKASNSAYNYADDLILNKACGSDGTIVDYQGVNIIVLRLLSLEEFNIISAQKPSYYMWYTKLPNIEESKEGFISRTENSLPPDGANYCIVQFNYMPNLIRVEQPTAYLPSKELDNKRVVLIKTYNKDVFNKDGRVNENGEVVDAGYWLHAKIPLRVGQRISAYLNSGSSYAVPIVAINGGGVVEATVHSRYTTSTSVLLRYDYVAKGASSYVYVNCFYKNNDNVRIEVYDVNRSFKQLGFIGDSITYGYDDTNNGEQIQTTWAENVCNKLQAKGYYNYGVSSATVMNVEGTPKAWCEAYREVDERIDILGVMIGINDAYRAYTYVTNPSYNPIYSKYVLGQMTDRTKATFYGALHIMWKGLLKKFPLSSGKKLYMIAYPHYDTLGDFWEPWDKAQREVAEYYSIPICDLRKGVGVRQSEDENHVYWGSYTTAHPTQEGANAFAEYIANWVNAHFSK